MSAPPQLGHLAQATECTVTHGSPSVIPSRLIIVSELHGLIYIKSFKEYIPKMLAIVIISTATAKPPLLAAPYQQQGLTFIVYLPAFTHTQICPYIPTIDVFQISIFYLKFTHRKTDAQRC